MAGIKGWFTMNGMHIPILEGQSRADAAKNYMNSKHGKSVSKLSSKKSVKGKQINTSKKSEVFKDSQGNRMEVKKAEPKEFKQALDAAKASNPKQDAWRVDNYSHTEADYKNDALFITKKGSVIAVTPDGDIISVCAKRAGNRDAEDRGRSIMEYAVKNGGKKLDSYSGNHGFYVKCGFEPVSYCKFDEKYAPPGWRKGIDKPEPIIFYKYTGKTTTSGDYKEALKNIKISKDYESAQAKRDKEVK